MPKILHNRIRSSMFPILVLALIVLLLTPAARAAAITEYILPPGQSGLPQGIAFQTSTDYVWFTEFGSYDKVGRLKQGTAEIVEFKMLTGSRPWDLAYEKYDATTENIWFTAAGRDRIASILISSPGPVFTLVEWALTSDANPRGIDMQLGTAPNRFVWFTEFGKSAIGKLDPGTNTATEWSLPDANAHPLDILYLPNSGAWFTEYDGNRIGFFNGVTLKEWPLILGSLPYKLANDTFGNIWFTESGRNRIAKLNPYTNEITEYLIPTANSQPYGIWVDSHNTVWFAEHATNKIGKFMPGSNMFVEYVRVAGASPWDVRATTDGKVWFSDDGGGRIGRLDPNVATSSMTVSTVSTASPILSTATTIGSSMTKTSNTVGPIPGQPILTAWSTFNYPYLATANTTTTTSYSASETSQIRRTSSMNVITSYVTQTAPTTITSTSHVDTTSGTTYVTATATTTLQATSTTTALSTSTSYIGTTVSTGTITITNTATSTSFALGTGGPEVPGAGAIPGFPVESIIAGIGVAVACLMIMRRVRIRSRGEK